MEQIIEEYYNSPCFADRRKQLELEGKDARKVIYDLVVDKNKLKDMLGQITAHNILGFFENLASNEKVNQIMTDSFKKVIQEAFQCNDIRDVINQICFDSVRKEEYLNIHKKILENIEKITEMQVRFNIKNMKLDSKIIQDSIKELIKSVNGNDISIEIEEVIKDMYKNNISIKDDTIDKITKYCAKHNIAFPEMITALMNNTQEKVIENTQLLIDTEFKIMHETFKKDLAKYLIGIENNYKEQHKQIELIKTDINNILKNMKRNNNKIEELLNKPKNEFKKDVSLIERIVEQTIDKKLNDKLNSLNDLLENDKEKKLEKKIQELEKKTKDKTNFLKHVDNINNSVAILANTITKIEEKISQLENHTIHKNEMKEYLLITDFNSINDVNFKDNLNIKKNITIIENKLAELDNKIKPKKQNINKMIDTQMSNLEKKIGDEFKKTKELLSQKLNSQLYETNYSNVTNKLIYLEKKLVTIEPKQNIDLINIQKDIETISSKIISSKLNSFQKSLNFEEVLIRSINVKEAVSKSLNEENIIELITNKIQEIHSMNMVALTNSLNDIHHHISILYQKSQYVHNIPNTYYFQ